MITKAITYMYKKKTLVVKNVFKIMFVGGDK